MLALTITAGAAVAILGLIWGAHIVDKWDSRSLHRAHHRQNRRRTIIQERGHGEQIIGEWSQP